MDLAQFRSILKTSGVDVWEVMEMAITVASLDHGSDVDNFKRRRDGIVERLYATTTSTAPDHQCQNCDAPEKSLIGKDDKKKRLILKIKKRVVNPQVSSALNDHHQIQNGSSSGSESENFSCNSKQQVVKPKEAAAPNISTAPSKRERQEEESDRLAAATKRLRQNYMNAENTKRQRMTKMMDIQELPKPIDHVLVGKKKYNGIRRVPMSCGG